MNVYRHQRGGPVRCRYSISLFTHSIVVDREGPKRAPEKKIFFFQTHPFFDYESFLIQSGG